MPKSLSALAILILLFSSGACQTLSDPGVAGLYSIWDDVINRWIGKQKADLYVELGPPNLQPKEAEDGMIEMV